MTSYLLFGGLRTCEHAKSEDCQNERNVILHAMLRQFFGGLFGYNTMHLPKKRGCLSADWGLNG